jgi:hypothetical protein
MTVTVIRDDEDAPVTPLTVTIDQAALLGLLRQFYSLDLPLNPVECIEPD